MKILPETSLSECRKNTFAFVSLFLLVLLVYSNTFDASWHFDDHNNIVKNKALHLSDITIENLKKALSAHPSGNGKTYRPISCLSFSLNYYFGGLNTTGYHIVNATIHFLAAVFLFLFVYKTLKLPLLADKYREESYFIALLSAVLWAINPVQTQAVTYIVQRMTSMAGLFYIMAMYFYCRGRMSAPGFPVWGHYILCVICGLLAMGNKENAVTLPFLLLIYDLFFIKGLTRKNIQKYALLLLPLFAIIILATLIIAGPSIFDPAKLIAGYQNRGFTLSERLLTEPRIIFFYISLLLYPMPHRLSLEHGIALSTNLSSPFTTFLSIAAIFLILSAAVTWARKWPLFSFCIIFFFLNHVIEGTIIPLELIFEHRNYVPSMLFFVPLSILLLKGIRRFCMKRGLQVMLITFVILVLIGWGHSTYARNRVWQNDAILSTDCIEKYPDLARPHHNLGVVYTQKKMYEKAISEYMLALSKENRSNLAWKNWTYYNLGSIYQKLENHEQAMRYYNLALKHQPDFQQTHINVGLIFMKIRDYEQARKAFHKAIKSGKANVSALGNLGFLAMIEGDFENARLFLKAVLKIDPLNTKALRHLALMYRMQSKNGKTLYLLQKALPHDSQNPFILLDLFSIYKEIGMKEEAATTLARWFDVFAGNPIHIQKFVERILNDFPPAGPLANYRNALLILIREACLDRGRTFQNLADSISLHRVPRNTSWGDRLNMPAKALAN